MRPETQSQGTDRKELQTRPKKFLLQEARVKNVDHFFDKEGTIDEFVLEGKTVNTEFRFMVWDNLLMRISRLGPQFPRKEIWFLLHDNAVPIRPQYEVHLGEARCRSDLPATAIT